MLLLFYSWSSHAGIPLCISGIKKKIHFSHVMYSLSISLIKCERGNESLALISQDVSKYKNNFLFFFFFFTEFDFFYILSTLEVFTKPSCWRERSVLLQVTWSHAMWNSHLLIHITSGIRRITPFLLEWSVTVWWSRPFINTRYVNCCPTIQTITNPAAF